MTTTIASGVTRTMSPLAAPVAVGCCLVAGATYVAVQDPSDGGVFLPCPFRVLTGWWCPGCGLTRATHHLFHGDIVQAFRFNMFVIVILGVLAATWVAWLLHSVERSIGRSVGRTVGGRDSGRAGQWAGRMARIPVSAQVAAGAALVGFAIVRNLPGIEGLRG